jgi:cell wall-associated NlpC family hydrolase
MTRQDVVTEALSWVGTPYHHAAAIKGVGVDCAMLVKQVFEACELIPSFEVASYVHDWHLNRSEELYLKQVEAYADEISSDLVLPGDLAVVKFARAFSHGAVCIGGGQVVHAYIHRPVEVGQLKDFGNREIRFYRVRSLK